MTNNLTHTIIKNNRNKALKYRNILLIQNKIIHKTIKMAMFSIITRKITINKGDLEIIIGIKIMIIIIRVIKNEDIEAKDNIIRINDNNNNHEKTTINNTDNV